jgi:hypothetical protein
MSRFEEIFGNNKPDAARPRGKQVEFYIDCLECSEEITEVEYFPNEDCIIFECSEGHRSIIEKFGIPL